MRTSKLPAQTDAIVEWSAQNCPSGPLFHAGCGNGELLNALTEGHRRGVTGCEIQSSEPRYLIQEGDFLQWWRRQGGEGTFAAVIALGWPSKLDWVQRESMGLPASVLWLLKPGGYFLCDWPKNMGKPIALAAALNHLGFKQAGGFDTAKHPVYIWQKG